MSAAIGAGLRYGALGLPLAFVALPLYVVLPNHYAEQFGVPLAALGAVLLAVRSLDALLDPWIGLRVNRLLSGRRRCAGRRCGGAAGGLPGCSSMPALRSELPARCWVWCRSAAAGDLSGLPRWPRAAPGLGRATGRRRRRQARRVAARGALALVGVVLASDAALAGQTAVGPDGRIVTLALGVLALAWRIDRCPGICADTVGGLARTRGAGVPAAAGGVRAQRHRQRGAGDAGAVLHPRPAAAAAVGGRLLASYFLAGALSLPRCGCARSTAWAWCAPGASAWCWRC